MKETLRYLFQQKFNRDEYRRVVLQNLLHAQQLLREPQFLEETNDGDRIYGLGYLHDADGKEIGLYYTDVVNGDVRRKRVGFRQMMKPYVKYGADAAIAVFADKEHWRLSYMCDLKGGETSAKRFSYVFGDPKGQYNTPSSRLANLGGKKIVLDDLKETFSVEALSKEFFKEYHEHYDCICDNIISHPHIDALTPLRIHDYVKKMMGRIVFLHFLQKKRWLDDDPEFLKNLFFMQTLDRKADFLEQVLEPLFFGIFNTESDQREKLFADEHWDKGLLKQWEKLPYLNGGLFERDEVDKLKIKLPASLFEDLFSFMASYNFTVDENDPDDAEVGVDPEMLGKIFESLLEDNKAKGAFYTPKEIVRYMCKESLIAYLGTRTSSSANSLEAPIRTFVETHEMQPELEPYQDSIGTALREVKICDPAIGSGAFPMGLLNELWRCREAIEETSSRVELKKEIIENNIYGVDIEKGAIDIARLRFWLSIVVDAEEPEPLPNFDYKFMQGNSLLENYKGFDLSRISNRLPGGQSKSTQLLLGLDSDLSRKNLQRLMRDYFSVTDHKQKASMRQSINDEVKHLIRDFIGGTSNELEKLDPSATQDFFLWHTWFKDIFDKGGFDIVIGNPPYGATINERKEEYKKRFLCTEGKYEIYKYFFEQATNLTRSKGIIALITPNTWQTLGYFKKMRQILFDKCEIISITDSLYNIFASATVDTMITLLRVNKGNKPVKYKFVEESLNTFYFLDVNIDNDYILCSKIDPIIRKIEKTGTVLGDIAEVWQGLIAYAGKEQPRVWSSTKKETEYHRKLLYGRDISKYAITWGGEYLKYGEWLHRPRPSYIFDNEKILVQRIRNPKLKTRLVCAYDNNGYINGTGLSNIVLSDQYKDEYSLKYIVGLLNSKLINYWFSYYFVDVNIKPEQLRKIPMPEKKTSAEIVCLVERIMSIKQKNLHADTCDLDNLIDQHVYALYNLTPEEIAIIEQN